MNIVLKFSPVARRYRERVRGRMLSAVGAELGSTTTWWAVDTELRARNAEVAPRTPRVHRVADHLPIYESVVDRTRPIRMLEVGSVYGDSLPMWQEYLHPDSHIVAIDVHSKLVKSADSKGVHVRIGVDPSVTSLRRVAAEFGPFDVIIDAGSQKSSDIVGSFRYLFEHALSETGVYVVEDVYCDYWTLHNSFSLFDVFRALIDVLHGHYRIATSVANFRVGHLLVVRRAAGIGPDASTGPE